MQVEPTVLLGHGISPVVYYQLDSWFTRGGA
jgi:hypothetical protein